ncbi:MAG: RDD family protein [Nitrospiria bacterium]
MEIITPAAAEQDHSYERGPRESPYRRAPATLPRPAGFIRRAVAHVIDGMILFTLFLCFIFFGWMGLSTSQGIDSLYYSGSGEIIFLAYGFLYVGYYTFFHAFGGQTPAKMILRIRVVNRAGESPSYPHALMRTFGFFLSHLFFGFGFFLALVDRKKRALHDLLVKTEVTLSD